MDRAQACTHKILSTTRVIFKPAMVVERPTALSQIPVERMPQVPGLNPAWGKIIPANKFIQIIFYCPYSAVNCEMMLWFTQVVREIDVNVDCDTLLLYRALQQSVTTKLKKCSLLSNSMETFSEYKRHVSLNLSGTYKGDSSIRSP